jgi:hypothetical protein
MTAPRNHNRLLAHLDWRRQRLDRASDLIEQAIDLREQLHWGIDLDHARDLVDTLKRGVAAYAQSAS